MTRLAPDSLQVVDLTAYSRVSRAAIHIFLPYSFADAEYSGSP